MPERLIGRTLGRYRVDALLGTGGFAWVFAASDPDLGVSVALKVLKPQYAGDTEFEERFRREASTAAKLKHPNIIKIYSVGAEQQHVFFAMDLYTQKLTQQIEVMGNLPEPALLKLGLDISSALGFAHRQGVIHRDIKTDNILFDDHGNAIVADFGIARAAVGNPDNTGTNVIMGTPQFFAPEQARGKKIDARADIYSLGVTLFMAATGQLPFSGADWYEIATKHVNDSPPYPRSLNPIISPEMERIILKCLEKDRENRYASADLLYADFEALARRRAAEDNTATILVSTPVTGRYQTIRPATQERGSRFADAFVALLLVLVAFGVFFYVDGLAVRSSPLIRTAGAIVGLNPTSAGGTIDDSVDAAARGTGGGLPGGGRSGGVSGGASQGNPSRFVFFVRAPQEAAILVNGVAVGTGEWQTDTLGIGNYRVSAQLPVGNQCIWGRDSTIVPLTGTGPANIVLKPRRCGNLGLVATRDSSENLVDARWEIRTMDKATLVTAGRLPLAIPLVLPAGKQWLVISAPNCSAFGDSVLVVPDSTVRRKIALLCR